VPDLVVALMTPPDARRTRSNSWSSRRKILKSHRRPHLWSARCRPPFAGSFNADAVHAIVILLGRAPEIDNWTPKAAGESVTGADVRLGMELIDAGLKGRQGAS